MYVCLCHCIRDRDLRQAAEAGVRSFEELQARTQVAWDVFDRALDPGELAGQPA
jgi:hypothetical protein